MLRDRIINNKLVNKFIDLRFYFEKGKEQIARCYQFIPDILIIFGGLKYLFKIDLTRELMLIIILVAVLVFTISGYGYVRLGFYDAEVSRMTRLNSIAQEQLDILRELKKHSLRIKPYTNSYRFIRR